MKGNEEEYAIACMVPVNAPGVKIVNTTYAPRHADTRIFPLSAKHHYPEGFVIFDDVFVPNERVFLDGETAYAAVFAHSLGLWERLGGLSSMADEADRLVGFAQLIAEANGLAHVGHIKEKISEMIIHATLIRAALEAAIGNCKTGPDGAAFPDELYTNAGKYHGAANYNQMVRHLHDIAGGSMFTLGIEVPPTAHSSLGCVIVGEDAELHELQLGLDQDVIASGGDAHAARVEETVPLDLAPAEYVTQAHAAILALVEHLDG